LPGSGSWQKSSLSSAGATAAGGPRLLGAGSTLAGLLEEIQINVAKALHISRQKVIVNSIRGRFVRMVAADLSMTSKSSGLTPLTSSKAGSSFMGEDPPLEKRLGQEVVVSMFLKSSNEGGAALVEKLPPAIG